MANNKRDNNRRRLLKALGAGGGAVVTQQSMPSKWARPVVDAVLLPAHAQTTVVNEPPLSCTFPLAGKSYECSEGAVVDLTFYQIRTADTPCGFEIIDSGSDEPSNPWILVSIVGGGCKSGHLGS